MRTILTLIIIVALAAGGYWGFQKFNGDSAGDLAQSVSEALDETLSDSDTLAFAEALRGALPKTAAADEAAFQRVIEAVNGIVSIEYEAFTDGAAKNVVLTAPGYDKAGVRVEALRLWGVDEAGLEALSAGDGLTDEARAQGVKIADRIAMTGAVWFGFDRLTQDFMDGYLGAVSSIVENAASEDVSAELSAAFDITIDQYDFITEEMIIDGLHLFPLEAPAEATDQEAGDGSVGLLKTFQSLARWSRALSFDAAAFYGSDAELAYSIVDQKNAMTMTMPVFAYKGYRRGDTELTVMRDFAFSVTTETEIPSEEGATPTLLSLDTSGSIGLYELKDIRLADAFAFLERGQMPPMSETDLLSLGVWRAEGVKYLFNDKPFYSIDRSLTDFSDFHWLIPTKITQKTENFVYDIEGLFGMVQDMAAADPASATEFGESFDQVVSIMQEEGFTKFVFDTALETQWAPETGETQGALFVDYKDFGVFDLSAAGLLPDYAALKEAAPAEGAPVDGEALMGLLGEASAIGDFTVVVKDRGGIQKSFALAVALAELAPDGNPGTAMLKGADPKDLRISSAAMMRLSAGQVAAAFPPARGYIDALANFVQKGGVLTISADPDAPVTASELQSLSSDPNALVNRFKFDMRHSKEKK